MARKKNKTIVSTIHQPSSQAYSYCDRLILLSDGNVVYQGPGRDSAIYFKLAESGNLNKNPCDYFMKILAVNYPKKAEDEANIKHWVDRYTNEQE